MNWNKEMIEQLRREDLFRALQERQPLRRHAYGDPARHVEFAAEIQRQQARQRKKQQQRQQQQQQRKGKK